MAFNHAVYNQRFLTHPGNEAKAYGVTIELARDKIIWRCIGIHHLTGSENEGNHHVYLDVLDEKGKRIEGARLMVSNAGKAPYPVVIDKPFNEAGANVPMYWNDTLSVYVGGDTPSDRAQGFHVRHADEGPGTTRGHHSFYVVWQRQTVGETPPVDPPPVEPGGWRDDLSPEELWIVNNIKLVSDLFTKMAGTLDAGSPVHKGTNDVSIRA